jgi:hypothetical protein
MFPNNWLILALACADKGEDSGSGEGAKAAPIVEWYLGSSDGQTPDGSYDEPAHELLFIRTLDPSASTITEEAWQEDGDAYSHYVLVHSVDLASQTFSADFETEQGLLQVLGGFDAGEDWAWSAWHSDSTYVDGAYAGTVVRSTDSRDSAGAVIALKEIYDETDAHIWSIVEQLSPITEEEFGALRADRGL